jgi:glutamate synthase domain-containing protein 2
MFSRRYLAMWCAVAALAACAALAAAHHLAWFWIIIPVLLVGLGLFDLTQERHAILRNYPLWGHLRFMFEFIRPEIRQYFVEDDTDEKPFSRAQRSIVYQRPIRHRTRCEGGGARMDQPFARANPTRRP